MENTLENKKAFLAAYWIWIYDEAGIHLNIEECEPDDFLGVKPLHQIANEHLYDISKILYPKSENWSSSMWTNENGEYFIESLEDVDDMELFGVKYPFQKTLQVIDFLRSNGYALSWNGISVEEQIEYGWIKLK